MLFSPNTFFSQLLSKNLKIKIYCKTIILPVVLYVCEAREECSRLRVFENRSLKRIFGPRGIWMVSGEDSTMRNFILCTVHQI